MLGQAALAMWWDMAPQVREEFEHWHSHEHFPERLALPGFLRATRWAQADGGEGFFVLYDLADYGALASPEYVARLNAPTEWSRRMMPHHRNMVRSPARVLASAGSAVAGHALTVRLSPREGETDRLRAHIESLLRELPQQPGLGGAHLLQTGTLAVAPTTEQKIRGLADRAADWVVLVVGYDAQVLARLARDALSPGRIHDEGGEEGAIVQTHALRLSVTAP